jgi:hypothetical protein
MPLGTLEFPGAYHDTQFSPQRILHRHRIGIG